MPTTRRMSRAGSATPTATEVISPRTRARPVRAMAAFSEDEDDVVDTHMHTHSPLADADPAVQMGAYFALSRFAFMLSAFIVALGSKANRTMRGITPKKVWAAAYSPEGLLLALLLLWAWALTSFNGAEGGASLVPTLAGGLATLDGVRHAITSLPERLWAGDSHRRVWQTNQQQGVQRELDYDALAEELVNSGRFQEMVREMTRKQLSTLEAEIMTSKNEQMEALKQLLRERDGKREAEAKAMIALSRDMDTFKLELEKKTKEELGSLQESLNVKMDEERQRLQITIDDLKTAQMNQEGAVGANVIVEDTATLQADVKALEAKLAAFENAQDSVRAQMTKCCQKNASVQSTVETIFKDWIAAITSNDDSDPSAKEFRQWLSANYVSHDQLQLRVASLLDTMKAEVREDVAQAIAVEAKKRAQESAEEAVKAFAMQHEDEIISAKAAAAPSSSFAINMSSGGSGLDVTSEAEISRIVQEALRKYDADKTGMFDFALESAGGTIATTRCTETHDVSNAIHSVFGIPFWWERNNPRTILQPGSSPGQCWAFKGSHGRVVVRLSGRVYVQAVSLEHIARMVAPDGNIASGPKDFAVYGLTHLEDERPLLLGNYTYVDGGNSVQTFYTPDSEESFDLIELKVLSNHGHPVYTCIYRFRLHGRMAEQN